jgi:hypothetical protein
MAMHATAAHQSALVRLSPLMSCHVVSSRPMMVRVVYMPLLPQTPFRPDQTSPDQNRPDQDRTDQGHAAMHSRSNSRSRSASRSRSDICARYTEAGTNHGTYLPYPTLPTLAMYLAV